MKENCLGIVFGPLLLDDKSEHILTDDAEDRGGLLALPQVDPVLKGNKRGKARDKLDPTYNKKQLERQGELLWFARCSSTTGKRYAIH